MSSQDKPEPELEIAHVLFIDTVGYSRLLINEQREILADLNRIVRSSGRFRSAESAEKLIRVPTGDGMALIFLDSPESPIQCAIEIGRAVRDHPRLKLRMGIHSGPVSRVVDVNDQSNVAGAGINVAERVMSCADAGHILISKHAAEDLAEYRHWQPHLHDIGECEVKHGSKVSLVNFYSDEVGNPELPGRCRESLERSPTLPGRLIRKRVLLATGAITILAIAFVLFAFLSGMLKRKSGAQLGATKAVIPEKSIAVLPFDNLSDDKRNAYFAEGVQDEILTNLVKVADIRVISRTSVMQYRSDEQRNLKEIGKALGVAHVLEGSVQRVGNKLRVSAQLVDTRSDAQEWAESYNREVADIFAIQSELAEQIVARLKAKLSPEEKAAIEERPTSDLLAYDSYVRARAVIMTAVLNVREKEKLFEAVDLLNDAIARDPRFFPAYYQLARTHDRLYILGIDHTPTRLQLADQAIKNALRLRPNSGEAHLALAAHLYTLRDYVRAREELAFAGHVLPNEPLVFELTGYMDRRQGNWDGAVANLERVQELDPRNTFNLLQLGLAYQDMRRCPELVASLDRALALSPKDIGTRVQRATADLDCYADPKPLHAAVEAVLADDPNSASGFAANWLYCALAERDQSAATKAISAMTEDGCRNEGIILPRAWCEGVAARTRGDSTAAEVAFTRGRSEIEKIVRQQPDYAEALCVLGLFDSALGRKEEAIAEGRRAVELLPVSKDAINGGLLLEYLAVLYAWVGEKDLAIQQLNIAIKVPSDLSYGQLRLHPYWDSLRSDPRFEEIVASLAPTASAP